MHNCQKCLDNRHPEPAFHAGLGALVQLKCYVGYGTRFYSAYDVMANMPNTHGQASQCTADTLVDVIHRDREEEAHRLVKLPGYFACILFNAMGASGHAGTHKGACTLKMLRVCQQVDNFFTHV